MRGKLSELSASWVRRRQWMDPSAAFPEQELKGGEVS
jgi:hypothetical protein